MKESSKCPSMHLEEMIFQMKISDPNNPKLKELEAMRQKMRPQSFRATTSSDKYDGSFNKQ